MARKAVFPEDHIPDVEAAVRAALALACRPAVSGPVRVGLAKPERPGRAMAAALASLITDQGWRPAPQSGQAQRANWERTYEHDARPSLSLQAADVTLVTARAESHDLLAVCRGGPIWFNPRNDERGILRVAIGETMLLPQAGPEAIVLTVVPMTERFRAVAQRWQERPLLKSSGLALGLVDRHGHLEVLRAVPQLL